MLNGLSRFHVLYLQRDAHTFNRINDDKQYGALLGLTTWLVLPKRTYYTLWNRGYDPQLRSNLLNCFFIKLKRWAGSEFNLCKPLGRRIRAYLFLKLGLSYRYNSDKKNASYKLRGDALLLQLLWLHSDNYNCLGRIPDFVWTNTFMGLQWWAMGLDFRPMHLKFCEYEPNDNSDVEWAEWIYNSIRLYRPSVCIFRWYIHL